MGHTKRILILYASAGHGHEKAAEAVLEACRESGAEAHAVDTLRLAPGFFGNFYRQTYLVQIKYMPWLWGVFYYSFDVSRVYAVMRWIRRFVNSMTSKRLEKLILDEKPDTIIATHFLSVEVVSRLKEKGKTLAKIIAVITDYLPHHVWTANCVDLYAVALAETKEALTRWGIAADKIKVTGIPVEKKFLENIATEPARRRLMLDPNLFTALITSGGAGIGSLRELVEGLTALKQPVQILAVCGTNKTLFQDLSAESRRYSSLKVFSFVDNMEELMAASDLVIGKGGGLTLTESFSKGKPVILFQSIPGQEARNAFCVQKYGAGFVAESAREAISKVSELLESPEKLESMKKGASAMFKGDAARAIARLA